VRPKVSWAGLICRTHQQTLPPPVTVKHRMVKFYSISGWGRDRLGKDFEKTMLLRWEWKTSRERSTIGLGSEHDDGEELGDDAPDLDW